MRFVQTFMHMRRRMNGGDDFYVCFENSDTKESTFAEITDHDDGSYTVKFSTKVTGVYTCSVMIGADEHVADSPRRLDVPSSSQDHPQQKPFESGSIHTAASSSRRVPLERPKLR